MVQSDTEYEFEKFLKSLELGDEMFIILPGAVISGAYLKSVDEITTKTIMLSKPTVHTGGSNVELIELEIPREKILAWGYGKEE